MALEMVADCLRQDVHLRGEALRILPDEVNRPLRDVCRFLPDESRMYLEAVESHSLADEVHWYCG